MRYNKISSFISLNLFASLLLPILIGKSFPIKQHMSAEFGIISVLVAGAIFLQERHHFKRDHFKNK
ncbi:MAG: hypothetical protein CLLPBCKN_000943 [Chroococcidiopsis cubana SAG 39.79]|nr:hypothetical protein [Chroococcidiopsis cubana SAG 39.79]